MKKRQVVVRTDGSRRNIGGSSIRNIRYVECQKNHAANIGGYAVDGCREFMASGEDGTTAALTCAACGCHRNFHRREVDGGEVVSECWFIMMIMFRPRLYEKRKGEFNFLCIRSVYYSLLFVVWAWMFVYNCCTKLMNSSWKNLSCNSCKIYKIHLSEDFILKCLILFFLFVLLPLLIMIKSQLL